MFLRAVLVAVVRCPRTDRLSLPVSRHPATAKGDVMWESRLRKNPGRYRKKSFLLPYSAPWPALARAQSSASESEVWISSTGTPASLITATQ